MHMANKQKIFSTTYQTMQKTTQSGGQWAGFVSFFCFLFFGAEFLKGHHVYGDGGWLPNTLVCSTGGESGREVSSSFCRGEG